MVRDLLPPSHHSRVIHAEQEKAQVWARVPNLACNTECSLHGSRDHLMLQVRIRILTHEYRQRVHSNVFGSKELSAVSAEP